MRRGRSCPVAVVLLALGIAGCAASAGPARSGVTGEITVSAASSLTDAFTEIAARFERANPGTRVTLNLGSSSVLAAQVRQGAPVDVFASADAGSMSWLRTAGHLAGPPRVFARNRLVLVTRPGNPRRIGSVADLRRVGTVALCAPSAPCGRYAARLVSAAGVVIPEPAVTRGIDARATLGAITAGDADAAIVYATDARAAGAAVTRVPIPEARDLLAVYPIAALRSSTRPALARAFTRYVRSPEGQSVLRSAGFLPAP